MWLKALKIAIVEQNIVKIDDLMDEVPNLSEDKEIDQALVLLAQATALISSLKDETSQSMLKIKQNIDYVNASETLSHKKLDITL